MLVLSRKPDEKIIIRHEGVEIVVTVTQVRGERVWIGIDAPPEVTIHRKEIQDAIDAEKGIR